MAIAAWFTSGLGSDSEEGVSVAKTNIMHEGKVKSWLHSATSVRNTNEYHMPITVVSPLLHLTYYLAFKASYQDHPILFFSRGCVSYRYISTSPYFADASGLQFASMFGVKPMNGIGAVILKVDVR